MFGLVCVYGVYRAIQLAWCSDDAFISFRYAKNLVDGLGLVYNAGEQVEAYTNFFWTVLVAGGMWLGIEPIIFSKVVGILFYGITAATLAFASCRLTYRHLGSGSVVVPFAAMAALVHHDLQVYATSGLETSMVTALITIGVVTLVLARRPVHFLLAGLVLIAAVLTRPDAAIAYAMALPFVVLVGGRRCSGRHWRNVGYYLMPLIVIYLPYWLIRFDYYGYPFPNSFYAKSGSESYYSQGLIYLWLYLKAYYPLLLTPVAVTVGLWSVARRWQERALAGSVLERAILLCTLVVLPFTVYVVRVGGDFMFARFLIPITPLWLLLLEAAVLRFIASARIRATVAVALAALVLLRISPIPAGEDDVHGIVNERRQYPPRLIDEARREGEVLKKYLSSLDVSVAYYGMKAMLVYYSEVPTAHEAASSLTDEYIAHLPLPKRGRPGHEKRMPYGYLVERDVNFILGGTAQSNAGPETPGVISFDGVMCQIVTYQDGVMRQLAAYPRVRFVKFPDFVYEYLAGIDTVAARRLPQDFKFFRSYYFEHNHAPRLYQRTVDAFEDAVEKPQGE
ncbi:hypothetical protein GF377_01740 [candidate division GN15 bacterium]|nr:hypothetical protein [candidate division GN15 bacterium]